MIYISVIALLYMIGVCIKPDTFMPWFKCNKNIKRGISIVLFMIFANLVPNDTIETNQDGTLKGDTIETRVMEDNEDIANEIKSARIDSIDLAKGDAFDVREDPIVQEFEYKCNVYKTYIQVDDSVENKELAELRKHNIKEAKKLWKKKLPSLRKKYAETLGNTLWEDDIEIKLTNGSSTIWFIGAKYAANRNIKKDFEKYYNTLETLGFKKVCFKWVDADVKYTSYTF